MPSALATSVDMSRQRNAVPQINPLYRFQWEASQAAHVLLYPEGMVKLNGSAGEILAACSGYHSVSDILAELSRRYPNADTLEADILTFLGEAHEKQWIRFR